MKQVRVLSVFALLFNLAIVGLVAYAGVVVLGQQFLNCLHFFTVESNVLIAVIALLCIPFNLIGIFKGKTLPKTLFVLKFIATVLIGITFFVATFFLSYLDNWDIAKQYGNFQFDNVAFYYHLLVPALALLGFVFFDRAKKVKFGVNFLPLIPFAAYCGFYGVNYFLKFFLDPTTNKYDWYGFTEINGLPGAIISLGIIAAFVIVLSILLFLLNKLFSKSIHKEEAEPQPQPQKQYSFSQEPVASQGEEQPVEEEEQEQSQEESAPVEEEEEVQEAENNEAEEVQEEERAEEAEEEEQAEEAEPEEEEEEPAEEEPVATKKPAAPKKAPAKKPAPVKKSAAPKKEAEKKPANDATKVYHLTKRKEDGMWAITFVGGKKPVKLFKTKKEAEEYLAVLTKNQGATALIRNSKGAKAGKFASSIKSNEDK